MPIKISNTQRTFDSTCTLSSNLTQNGMTEPIYRDIVEYADPRYLITYIVAGAKSPWDLSGMNTKTKIGLIPDSKTVGANGYRYRKQGRITTNNVINSQVGTSDSDGGFRLSLKTNYLVPGMNVKFYNRKFHARVVGLPTGSDGNWIYEFKSIDGTVFDWNVHVAPQAGEKTCFGMFTTYGEASVTGYGRSFFPEEYINHLSIQRKTIALSGDALTDVTWTVMDGNGKTAKGWRYTKERQAKIQFLMEDEWIKWFGRSSMVDPNTGALLTTPRLKDKDTGNDIIQGNGVIAEIEGGNESWGSGPDGFATWDDFADMMKTLKKKSMNAQLTGKRWICVTGSDGFSNMQRVAAEKFVQLGGQINVEINNKTGGADISVGANFGTINFEGNALTVVEHPMFDDELAWSELGSDGSPVQSGMYVFIEANVNGNTNMEILTKGAYGINRSMLATYLNGMTGINDMPVVSPVDGLQYHMLKHDGLFIYNTESCGIIHRTGSIT